MMTPPRLDSLVNASLRMLALAWLTLCAALYAAPAYANVIASGTRVVVPANRGGVTLSLTNDDDSPVLVEAWIDVGDEQAVPSKVRTPFLVTPQLFLMDAHANQKLRVAATSDSLPKDRESLFWLNILEIPPHPAEAAGKQAFRSRLKLFYRPSGLRPPLPAPGKLTWKLVPQGAGYALEASNPTPYYVTVVHATVSVGSDVFRDDTTHMLAPLGSARLPLKGLSRAPSGPPVVGYDVIDDYGAIVHFQATTSP